MGTQVPLRLSWAVETLGLGPDDRVLEIGCGRGVAAALVLDRLDRGTYLGLDRSSTAIEAAVRRNRDAVTAGRAGFLTTSLDEAEFEPGSFDKIFAVNVNLFWTGPAEREPPALRPAAGSTCTGRRRPRHARGRSAQRWRRPWRATVSR